eukprot:scaffold81544_cov38-Prasinocladus_malaysianus.AAC.1
MCTSVSCFCDNEQWVRLSCGTAQWPVHADYIAVVIYGNDSRLLFEWLALQFHSAARLLNHDVPMRSAASAGGFSFGPTSSTPTAAAPAASSAPAASTGFSLAGTGESLRHAGDNLFTIAVKRIRVTSSHVYVMSLLSMFLGSDLKARQ